MITISEAHYLKLKEVVQLLHSHLDLQHPANEHLIAVCNAWRQINQQLQNVYSQLANDLEQLIQSNRHLQVQSRESQEQINTLKGQLADATRLNTMQHSQLAKNLAELNKYKELVRQMKAKSKQKEQLNKEKDELIEELAEKAKKYKKMYYQQIKKVQKMETMLTLLEVTQKSSAKERELDEEMLQIEQELQNLQQDEGLKQSA